VKDGMGLNNNTLLLVVRLVEDGIDCTWEWAAITVWVLFFDLQRRDSPLCLSEQQISLQVDPELEDVEV